MSNGSNYRISLRNQRSCVSNYITRHYRNNILGERTQI